MKEGLEEAKNPGLDLSIEEDHAVTIPSKLKLQQTNFTQLDKNGYAIIEGDADVVGVAEHKLRK